MTNLQLHTFPQTTARPARQDGDTVLHSEEHDPGRRDGAGGGGNWRDSNEKTQLCGAADNMKTDAELGGPSNRSKVKGRWKTLKDPALPQLRRSSESWCTQRRASPEYSITGLRWKLPSYLSAGVVLRRDRC